MKRFFQGLAIAAMILSLTSCGLPGALVRSGGNLVKGIGNLAGPALKAGALL